MSDKQSLTSDESRARAPEGPATTGGPAATGGPTVTGGALPAMGRRGEGWVALQVALLTALFVAGVRGPRWPGIGRRWRRGAAVPLAAVGAWLLAGGGARLGRQLTPFPKPVEDGALRREGVYGLVRHPMYGGVLLLAVAWTFVSSPLAAAPSALAAAFVAAKRRREEAWLLEKHPGYSDYMRDVPRSLIPWVW